MPAKIAIEQLLCYGVHTGLIKPIDKIYCRNILLDILDIPSPIKDFDENNYIPPQKPYEILDVLVAYAQEKNIISKSQTEKDLFDTRIMDVITPMPSAVLQKYSELKSTKSIKAATNWYYAFSKSTNYIRQERIEKNLIWQYSHEKYGTIDITINLSKPEKDPAEIAKLKYIKSVDYPACLLCAENVGYAGRLDHPARHTHRIIPITLNNESWFYQYSPYIYFNEHIIALRGEHIPMLINRDTFIRLLEFTKQIPHYFLGSNAGLPIVGGSILCHDHYQGGGYDMPMAQAKIYSEFAHEKFSDVKAGLINWPMTCIRLQCKDIDTLADAANMVLENWRKYSDEKRFIFSHTIDERHNTITPIARNRGDFYEMDLVLRNNITTEQLPMGVYHPHPHLHHIKKENIGLIEVMGVFILPGRLKKELDLVEKLLTGKDIEPDDYNNIQKHSSWIDSMKSKYVLPLDDNSAHSLIQNEIGKICIEVIECAGVFKDTDDGRCGAIEFMQSCGFASIKK